MDKRTQQICFTRASNYPSPPGKDSPSLPRARRKAPTPALTSRDAAPPSYRPPPSAHTTPPPALEVKGLVSLSNLTEFSNSPVSGRCSHVTREGTLPKAIQVGRGGTEVARLHSPSSSLPGAVIGTEWEGGCSPSCGSATLGGSQVLKPSSACLPLGDRPRSAPRGAGASLLCPELFLLELHGGCLHADFCDFCV